MLTKPILLPAWVVGSMALASGIIIAFGIVVAVAVWALAVPHHTTFTPEEKAELTERLSGGTFIDAGTYRKCINGSVWFFYSGGYQATMNQGCWK